MPREGLRQVQGRAASLNPSPPLYTLGLNFCSSDTVCVFGQGKHKLVKCETRQFPQPKSAAGWIPAHVVYQDGDACFHMLCL